MGLRRDALAAAAEWICAVEATGQKTEGLVATVGKVEVEPNAANVIPGRVRVSLDVRHAWDAAGDKAVEELLAEAQRIADRRGVSCVARLQLAQAAVPMDEELTELLAEAVAAAGFPVRRMASGAGHDSMVMATRLPTAMLFLRSPGGISHHPEETVLEEDVAAALEVGALFLRRLCTKSG